MLNMLSSAPDLNAPTLRFLLRPRVLHSLHKSLAIGLLLALSFLPAASRAVEPSTDHNVVIVGGGVSGLYAA